MDRFGSLSAEEMRRLRLELDLSRRDLARDVCALREELNLGGRMRASLRRHRLPSLATLAAVAFLAAARFGRGRRRAEQTGGSGFGRATDAALAALKILTSLARPFAGAYAARLGLESFLDALDRRRTRNRSTTRPTRGDARPSFSGAGNRP
jgi:hypothetical protein